MDKQQTLNFLSQFGRIEELDYLNGKYRIFALLPNTVTAELRRLGIKFSSDIHGGLDCYVYYFNLGEVNNE